MQLTRVFLIWSDVHHFHDDINIVEQPVHEIEGSGRHIRNKSEPISCSGALQNNLYPFDLKQRFKQPKKRS